MTYGAITAVRGASLRVADGEVVVLAGANGAGKTSTLQAISGLVRPSGGRLTFRGERIERLAADGIVRLGIAQVLEGRQLFPRMTVLENLQMGAYLRSDSDGVRSDLERAWSLFPALLPRRDQLAGTLSGGEQQMVAIARALMARPRLLLLDEPSMGLAPLVIREILRVLGELNRGGMTILLAEQNARIGFSVAQRGYVMETGNVVLEGTAQELMDNPIVQHAYLG